MVELRRRGMPRPANTTRQIHETANPDLNIRSEMRKDTAGRAFAMIDTLGSVARTWYSAARRVLVPS